MDHDNKNGYSIDKWFFPMILHGVLQRQSPPFVETTVSIFYIIGPNLRICIILCVSDFVLWQQWLQHCLNDIHGPNKRIVIRALDLIGYYCMSRHNWYIWDQHDLIRSFRPTGPKSLPHDIYAYMIQLCIAVVWEGIIAFTYCYTSVFFLTFHLHLNLPSAAVFSHYYR